MPDCELAEPLNDLPPVDFAFTYGSGVFPQPGGSDRSMPEVLCSLDSVNLSHIGKSWKI
jgi:hypothetical protein